MLTELGLYKLFGEDPERAQRFARVLHGAGGARARADGYAYGADRVPDVGRHRRRVEPPERDRPADPRHLLPAHAVPMAKIELLEVPVAGELLRWLGSFAVRRGEGDRDSIRVARWVVAEGHAVGFFIEGTRQQLGYPGAGHAGAAMIAIQEGVPLVPVRARHLPVVACATDAAARIVWGEPIDLSGLPRNGKGYKEGAAYRRRGDSPALAAGGRGRRRQASRRSFPTARGARAHLSGDDVSYVDAKPWPDDEWARGPLGPVYPGPQVDGHRAGGQPAWGARACPATSRSRTARSSWELYATARRSCAASAARSTPSRRWRPCGRSACRSTEDEPDVLRVRGVGSRRTARARRADRLRERRNASPAASRSARRPGGTPLRADGRRLAAAHGRWTG